MKFKYDDFFHQANHEYLKYDHVLRYGQFLMNYLSENHSEIKIPAEIDCFYDNSKIPLLFKFLSEISIENF